MGSSKSSSKREVYTDKYLQRKKKYLKLCLKELEKEEQTKPKLAGRKKIKIRAEINEIENMKTIE